ncbi:MAG: hypothetical protein JNL07_12170 [Rhodospirillales bacterium]|nr:hypothetical protein [Rhodospirillales bacterium]
MSSTGRRDDSILPVLRELADSGEFVDLADIEAKLEARGYSPAGARAAFSDPELRRAMTMRCVNARVRKLGSQMAHPARLDPSALHRKPFRWS